MPIVHIDLLEGRPPERISTLIREVSQAVSESLDAPIGSVRVIVNEMQEHQYGVGGEPWPDVKRARDRSREAAKP